MSCQENAILVLSGKILDQPVDLEMFDPLCAGIERELSTRHVTLTRRLVTIAPQHYSAVPYLLAAGFEIMPADDEEAQTTAAIFDAISVSDRPVDEVVMMLGAPEPVQILRLLAGRVTRTLLLRDEISEDLRRNIDGCYMMRDLLSKEGVAWSGLKLREWPTAASPAPIPVASEAVAAIAEESASGSDSDSVVDVDALCVTEEVDPYALVKESAVGWNEELESIVLEHGLKYYAAAAVQQTDYHFPGLNQLYREDVDSFRDLLDRNKLILVQEGEGDSTAYFLYHATHPEMRPASLGIVDIGKDAPQEEPATYTSTAAPKPFYVGATNFEQIMTRSELLARECAWSAERQRLIAAGNDYETEVAPKDRELEELAREDHFFMWPIGCYTFSRMQTPSVTAEDFLKFEKLYLLLHDSVKFFIKADANRARLETSFMVKAQQAVVDAQCLLKSMFLDVGFPFQKDPVQNNVFSLIADYRRDNYPMHTLRRMRLVDRMSVSEYDETKETLKAYREELNKNLRKFKGLEESLDQLKTLAEKLSAAQNDGKTKVEDTIDQWNELVGVVTNLCVDYKEPPSSKRLRDPLYNLVNRVPDDVDATAEFALVCREVDLVKMREEEEFLSVTESKDSSYSEEIQLVRRHYNGAKAVFVGGTPTPHICERMESKLNLRVVWDAHDHGDSLDRFSKSLNDPEVKLFIVYIPWCSHKHSRELSDVVQKYGKDLVRVRKGTSPELVANAICSQVNMEDDDLLFDAMDNPQLLDDDE